MEDAKRLISLNARDFDDAEIGEINNYITKQIPQTILPTLFTLSEDPIKKAKVFTAIYRIMEGVKDFASKEDTKKKLIIHLDKTRPAYISLYSLINEHDKFKTNYSKLAYQKKINTFVAENVLLINNMINNFLVFAEKIELINTDSLAGIKLDVPEGQDLYEKITEVMGS